MWYNDTSKGQPFIFCTAAQPGQCPHYLPTPVFGQFGNVAMLLFEFCFDIDGYCLTLWVKISADDILFYCSSKYNRGWDTSSHNINYGPFSKS